jgi:polyisoprenoid-binding protein YceI
MTDSYPNNRRPDTSSSQHLSRWKIDPDRSEVRFSVRHVMVSTVTGRFTRFGGDLLYDHQLQQPAGVMVEIEAASVDTGQVQRDIHLRSGDFFDTENYPYIRFASRDVEYLEDDRYRVHGDLRLLRSTREIILDVTFTGFDHDPSGREIASFTASTEINRQDFGLTWNRAVETGGVMVGDTVNISLEIRAFRTT